MDPQTNATLTELEKQRNAALTESALKAGQLAVAYNEIKELREKIAELEKKLNAPDNVPESPDAANQSDD
jgi:uncharacterized pyridoxal phosphate-containing UPF0001 family protein